MANTYRDAILDTAAGVAAPWRVLWPPTGSGKNLGAKVYAALQAAQNAAASQLRKPVGILIVTRLIAQADEMMNAINTLAGREVAVADHSAHRATHEQLHESDVLVVTHQAYVNATQNVSNARDGKWGRLTNWKGGRRLLMPPSAAAESFAVQRRRESRREEWSEQTKLAGMLAKHLDPSCTFWTSLENKPISRIGGIFQKKRGVRSGLPDVLVLYCGN